jgi:hypothetical protein
MKYLGFVLFLLFSSNPAVAKMGALFDPDGTRGGGNSPILAGIFLFIIFSYTMLSFFGSLISDTSGKIRLWTFVALSAGFYWLGVELGARTTLIWKAVFLMCTSMFFAAFLVAWAHMALTHRKDSQDKALRDAEEDVRLRVSEEDEELKSQLVQAKSRGHLIEIAKMAQMRSEQVVDDDGNIVTEARPGMDPDRVKRIANEAHRERKAAAEEQVNIAAIEKYANSFPNYKKWDAEEKKERSEQFRNDILDLQSEVGRAFLKWRKSEDAPGFAYDTEGGTNIPTAKVINAFMEATTDGSALSIKPGEYKSALTDHSRMKEDRAARDPEQQKEVDAKISGLLDQYSVAVKSENVEAIIVATQTIRAATAPLGGRGTPEINPAEFREAKRNSSKKTK